mgnify:CR=1 FL=1
MNYSYPYISQVSLKQKSRRKLAGRLIRSHRDCTSSASEAMTFRHGIMFVTGLLTAAATIEEAPLIALAALAMMVWAERQINKKRKEDEDGTV